MSNGPDISIEKKLRIAWSQEQRFFHIRGFARLLIWAVVLLLVDLVVDWQILFRSRVTGAPQILLLVTNVFVLGWVLWHEWLRHLKSFDAVRVSLEVEAKHPELRSVLVSYTQFEGQDFDPNLASASLLGAMRNQAISLTRPLDFREVVDFRQLRNLFLFAVVSIGVFSLISYSRSDHMRSLFLRLVGVDKDYPTETDVVLLTKNITIKQGDSIEIVARAKGKIPEAGRLYVRSESDRAWQSMAMDKEDGGVAFKHVVPEVFEHFTYYIRIGDALTEKYMVSVSPRPEILDTQITLAYPEYLERDGSTEPPVDSLNLSVPEGTRVKWSLKCSPAIRALDVIKGENKFAATISEGGLVATFEIPADETFKYTFHWTEKDHGFEYDDLQHIVRVVPDRIPDIELIEPSVDGKATVKKVLDIIARVSDDHQLGAAELVYSINGSEEKSIEMEPLSGALKEIRHPWTLLQSIPDLKPGDQLSFSIKVSDKVPPKGSHINISATRRLAILTQEQYLAWFKNELDAQREIIGKARDLEKKATTEVRKLKNEETKEATKEDNEPKEEPK
jgi:hypothetical protein